MALVDLWRRSSLVVVCNGDSVPISVQGGFSMDAKIIKRRMGKSREIRDVRFILRAVLHQEMTVEEAFRRIMNGRKLR
jgi:hypothetical protein